MPAAAIGSFMLYADTRDVRIFAGAKYVSARPVTDEDRVKAIARLNIWASAEESHKAMWAACECQRGIHSPFYKLTFAPLRTDLRRVLVQAGSTDFFTSPSNAAWTTYTAIIIIVSYGVLQEGKRSFQGESYFDFVDGKIVIEPILAHSSAVKYITRMLTAKSPANLLRLPDKNKSGALIAVGVCLLSKTSWGISDFSQRPLFAVTDFYIFSYRPPQYLDQPTARLTSL